MIKCKALMKLIVNGNKELSVIMHHEEVGTMYFDYDEMREWLKGRSRIGGWIKEWLSRFAKEHGLEGATLVREVLEYVPKEQRNI